MNMRFFITFALALSAAAAFAESFFVEAESFADKGGWAVDQQFMDQMGSPYLIAHGLGRPVADASAVISVPAPGKYHVYVRTYNWTSPWHSGKGPGAFAVAVDGKRLRNVVGDKGNAWEWQYAGAVAIKDMQATVSLKDLTGFDGRCDALYFTTDKTDVPADDMCRPRKEAVAVGGFDFVVVGGGIAGMSAAMSAARLGSKVALIHDRPVLGGNNSSEVRVHLGGAVDVGPYPAVGALVKEYGPGRGGNAKTPERYEDSKKQDWIDSEKNIRSFMNCHVNEVFAVDGHIDSLIATDIMTGERFLFAAPLFADCTGDGTVGYLAGADYLYGRECLDDFGESMAPERPDSMTMGASVQWRTRKATDGNASFPEFSYGLELDDESCRRVSMGEWTWENGMRYHQVDCAERVRDYGLLVVYTNWSYIRNKLGLFPDRSLDWVAYIAGKRESRRLMGDYILKQDDILKQVSHEDASFTTTWTIDLHFPDPENSALFPGEEFFSATNHVSIEPYAVPYRCLYSRNVDNLFMVGRDISVTHVALGTVRLMRTCGMMGEVVGMASSLCRKYGVGPRDVYRCHLPELRRLMKKGVAKDNLPDNQKYNALPKEVTKQK